MSRLLTLTIFAAISAASLLPGRAEESSAAQEVRELRAAIEKQSKQLDLLAEQVARLRQAVEGRAEASAAVAPASPAPAETVAAPAAAKAEFSPEAPKAEPPDGKRHVVVKGETLTSIAKHYSITIAELKKANKEMDERKLQIGQSLAIPQPKSPEASSEKKENP